MRKSLGNVVVLSVALILFSTAVLLGPAMFSSQKGFSPLSIAGVEPQTYVTFRTAKASDWQFSSCPLQSRILSDKAIATATEIIVEPNGDTCGTSSSYYPHIGIIENQVIEFNVKTGCGGFFPPNYCTGGRIVSKCNTGEPDITVTKDFSAQGFNKWVYEFKCPDVTNAPQQTTTTSFVTTTSITSGTTKPTFEPVKTALESYIDARVSELKTFWNSLKDFFSRALRWW